LASVCTGQLDLLLRAGRRIADELVSQDNDELAANERRARA